MLIGYLPRGAHKFKVATFASLPPAALQCTCRMLTLRSTLSRTSLKAKPCRRPAPTTPRPRRRPNWRQSCWSEPAGPAGVPAAVRLPRLWQNQAEWGALPCWLPTGWGCMWQPASQPPVAPSGSGLALAVCSHLPVQCLPSLSRTSVHACMLCRLSDQSTCVFPFIELLARLCTHVPARQRHLAVPSVCFPCWHHPRPLPHILSSITKDRKLRGQPRPNV